MKPSVYLETTIPSYLTAWRSPELAMAAKQQSTRQWWDTRSHAFDLFISEFVLQEASAGDPDAAEKRLAVLEKIPLLDSNEEVDPIAKELILKLHLPERAVADAAHIAICVVNGIDFLLTWNFTHIANASFRPRIEQVCRAFGFDPPVICSPEELMEANDEA